MLTVCYSHCNTCKFLSGSAYTLNQIVPKSDFKITKGSTKTFTYYGDSGALLGACSFIRSGY
jgi:hypothetical protein